MTADLHNWGATALARALLRREFSAESLTDLFLTRIDAHNPALKAFVEVWHKRARNRARSIDAALARGENPGPLSGVPIAIKDNFCCAGERVTCGSKILAKFTSPYSATAIERLEAAGAVLIGRTNMDEFAMGSSCEHSSYGPTHNPFDLECSPGGSSGGSAAAVAARLVPAALGSDTGGSVRQPAALCGIPGLKPTYGRISRYGMVAFASSLDHVAPFARNAEDLSLLLSVLSGHDERDATSLDLPLDLKPNAATNDLQGLRIGIPEQYFGEGLDPEIEQSVRQAIDALKDLGASLVEVSLPHTRYAIPTYHLICTAEASSNLSRYDGVRYGHRSQDSESLEELFTRSRTEGFGEEVKRRILLGTFCLQRGYIDDYYHKATLVRTRLRQDFEQAFTVCDVLAAPTSPGPAFKLGSMLEDPLTMYLNDILTAPANLAGIPALSTPCGFTEAGLPIGLQLQGPVLSEAELLRCAKAYQAAHPHHLREPQL